LCAGRRGEPTLKKKKKGKKGEMGKVMFMGQKIVGQIGGAIGNEDWDNKEVDEQKWAKGQWANGKGERENGGSEWGMEKQ
jgi:hypothetical protein